jgi:hypothetical protein
MQRIVPPLPPVRWLGWVTITFYKEEIIAIMNEESTC